MSDHVFFDECVSFGAREMRRASVLAAVVRIGVVHWTAGEPSRVPFEQSAVTWFQRRLDWKSNVRRLKRRKELDQVVVAAVAG